ncbi:uncharacterized protein PHACADRAFT_88937 [Phanerochaete carnosa HHB-10118-sp]|uniref:PIN domain-like protein n=1 Tax=Phanerochaete carnosa (strain HHB-10118-sp) TaxID=650164 RepID=K5V5Y2_PHACS|nr:uncharacterized protein PHACADRAFT_88937 [Phanerochaete carnosa HHB-10118-sp]EKM58106.1 hypothetical protein PHACADRAFT_88937 [Phanerochaete carnosa HHB-10118-sp]
MGVIGLTPFLQKACPDVIRVLPDRLKNFAGKKIVLDGTLITQRLHFAPLPHAYRHVLGWYRILHELREAGVSAVCVFDGRSRSLAKQMEVDRRREIRKVTAARGLLETNRLQRLCALSNSVKTWKLLDTQARESATRDLRDRLQELKPVPPSPDYIDGISQPSTEEATQTGHQQGRNWKPEAYSETHGELSGDGLALPRKRTEAPDTTSPPSGEKPASAPELDLVEAIRSSLANLYVEYKASVERLDSLPEPIPTPSQPSDDDPSNAEVKTEYMMSKTQHQLALEEGAFWSKFAELELAAEDVEDAATVLTQKSTVLFDSYSRRTQPPTTQTYDESKEIIRAMGVPCIEPDGPFEAEALAASMVLHGQADYVASEDTDVIVYGAPLMRNIAKRSDPLVILNGTDVRAALELDHERFVDFALLLGTDFSQRIKNVGPTRALKFIREYGSIEQMLEQETRYPPRVPLSLYLQQVEVARVVFHTLPPVPDESALQEKEPDDTAIQEILQEYGLWKELSHDFEGDFTHALAGNHFDDNPAVA